MKSKSVTIVIVIAIIVGIIAIVGITALIIFTTKKAEPRVVDMNQGFIDTIDGDQNENSNSEEDRENENNEGNDDEDDNDRDSDDNNEAKSFNSKFENYEGDRVSGDKVNDLIEEIRKNNEENENHQIRALANVQNWDQDNNKASEDSKYDIDFEKDEESGYITTVKIKDAE